MQNVWISGPPPTLSAQPRALVQYITRTTLNSGPDGPWPLPGSVRFFRWGKFGEKFPTVLHGRRWGEMTRGGDGMYSVWALPGSGLGLGMCDLFKGRWMDDWERMRGGECRPCSRTGSQCDWEPVRLGLKGARRGNGSRGGETLHPIKGAEVRAWWEVLEQETPQRRNGGPQWGAQALLPTSDGAPAAGKLLSGVGGGRSPNPCPLSPGWSVPPGARAHIPHPSLVLKASLFHWPSCGQPGSDKAR